VSLVDVTAAPKIMTIGGSAYKVGPLSLFQLGILQRYINDAAQSPFAAAKAEAVALEVPSAEIEEWLAEPRKQSRGWKPPEIGVTPGWPAILLGTFEGVLTFIYATFQVHNPGFAMEDAERIATVIGQKELTAIFNVALDIQADDAEGDEAGPKAPSPATSTPTSAETCSKPTESSPTPSPGSPPAS
jgi:hypothetical protein